ncbi:MAG: 7TM diverse intracellular signaling domain-containing protein, partial [Spirochaetota bacterium]|nr:7TM diverse intracellular signaling domain-containing protein [Spirochaetota bacterium]
MGILLFMGFYYILLFWFRRKDRSPLYFGIFCILGAVFNIQIFLTTYFPGMGLSLRGLLNI